MKRDTRMADEAGMTDRETIIKGLEWWVKHQEDEVLPLAYSAVVETLKVLKEQEAAYQGAVELLRQKTILFDDAIKRLKEQEAVKPVPPEDEFGLYRCGKCHHQLFRCVDKYCSKCGQAVKWE